MEKDLTRQEARWIAEVAGYKLPRAGYEIYLGRGLYLVSNLHFQFGAIGKPRDIKPYRISATRQRS